MKWINSKEKLPEIGLEVLGYSDEYAGDKPFLTLWNGEYWEDLDYENENPFRKIHVSITHWMRWQRP